MAMIPVWLRQILLMLLLFCSLGACTAINDDTVSDPTTGMTRGDFRQLRDRFQQAQAPEPPIPPVIQPTPQTAEPEQLVSISLTEQNQLRSVLMQLAKKAKRNLELDPRISGSIIFTATDQPFSKVLKHICDLAGLRARQNGNFIRIELDEPYTKTYHLDYPSLSRKTESEVSISTNVFNADVGGSNNQTNTAEEDNNSEAKVKSSSEADFWKDVEQGLDSILTNTAPQLTAGASPSPKAPAKASINRQAGVVSVFGTEKQQQAVTDYLQSVEQRTNAQVLIEARIVEVELSEDHKTGINWRTLLNDGTNFAARFGTDAVSGPFNAASTATSGVFTASIEGADMATILNLVRSFGTTRILSSPRLTVLNNQTAILKVARNEVYFTTSAQFPTSVTTGGVTVSGTPVFTSTPRTVPVGLVMTVQPAIDETQQDITMTLRPTISRVVDRVKDPSIGLNAAQQKTTVAVDSLVPVLAVREMDSVLRMRSGEVAIMGGLMQDSSQNTDNGVPGLDELPIIGELAKARDDQAKLTELVILLRATVMPRGATPAIADQQLYQIYGRDPRPLLPVMDKSFSNTR